MSIKPPFTELEIEKAPSGFYEGYSLPIALISKLSITLLVLWAVTSAKPRAILFIMGIPFGVVLCESISYGQITC